MNWIPFAGVILAACALMAMGLASRGRGRAESENLVLVRHRRALRDELRSVVPDDFEASGLVHAAARHLGVSGLSTEALQAAIEQGRAVSGVTPDTPDERQGQHREDFLGQVDVQDLAWALVQGDFHRGDG